MLIRFFGCFVFGGVRCCDLRYCVWLMQDVAGVVVVVSVRCSVFGVLFVDFVLLDLCVLLFYVLRLVEFLDW